MYMDNLWLSKLIICFISRKMEETTENVWEKFYPFISIPLGRQAGAKIDIEFSVISLVYFLIWRSTENK